MSEVNKYKFDKMEKITVNGKYAFIECKHKFKSVPNDDSKDSPMKTICEYCGIELINPNEEPGTISNLQVLESNAGYYIGRTFKHLNGLIEPYSRESNYFQTKEAAQQALDNNTYIPRLNP